VDLESTDRNGRLVRDARTKQRSLGRSLACCDPLTQGQGRRGVLAPGSLLQFLAFRGARTEIAVMSIGDLPIKVDRSAVAEFCSQRGIRRLALFGSVLRQDFNPEKSDVDVLADFQPGALRGLGLGYFDFGPDLSRILGHRVDFCSRLNRHIRPLVEREMLVIHEQP